MLWQYTVAMLLLYQCYVMAIPNYVYMQVLDEIGLLDLPTLTWSTRKAPPLRHLTLHPSPDPSPNLDPTPSPSPGPTPNQAPPLRRLGHAAGYACGRLLIFGGRDAVGKNKVSGILPPGVEAEPVHSLASLKCSDFPQQAALHFPGDNNMFVQVKTSPSLNRLQNQLSLEAWVKPAGFVTGAPVACKASASAPLGTALGFQP